MDENNKTFQREVLDRLITIENKLNDMPDIKKTTYGNQQNIIKLQDRDNQQQKTIDGILDDQKWMKRTILAAAITVAVGIVAAYFKTGLGL